jgi:hypothetical protein
LAIQYIWKPLDIGGRRLYGVDMKFLSHPENDIMKVVAAKSPRHALELVQNAYEGTTWIESPLCFAHALNVLQPESWYKNGVPCCTDTTFFSHLINGHL